MAPKNRGLTHKLHKQERDKRRFQAFAARKGLKLGKEIKWRLIPIDIPARKTLRIGSQIIETPEEYDVAIAAANVEIRELMKRVSSVLPPPCSVLPPPSIKTATAINKLPANQPSSASVGQTLSPMPLPPSPVLPKATCTKLLPTKDIQTPTATQMHSTSDSATTVRPSKEKAALCVAAILREMAPDRLAFITTDFDDVYETAERELSSPRQTGRRN